MCVRLRQYVALRAMSMAFVLMIMLSVVTLIPTVPIAFTTSASSNHTRIDNRLLNLTSSSDAVDVMVQYDGPSGDFKARAAIRAADNLAELIEVYDNLNMMRVKLVGKAIPKIASSPYITGIWSNEIMNVTPSNPLSSTTSSTDANYTQLIDLIGAREFWNRGYNGSGIVIAVLDTGIDFLHPDLDDFDEDNNTIDPKVTAFASFVEGDSLPLDVIGHGTYVASIVAGTGNKSAGLYTGIAPGATLLSGKVTLGGLLAVPSWIVSGIEWAANHGADIILLPFNTFGTPGDVVSEAVRTAAEKGILVISAAGDDGPDYLTIMSPGGSMASLTVGAYDTRRHEVPSFSGRGPSLEMLSKPDLVAPGVGIIGAKAGTALQDAGFGDFDLGDLGEISNLLGGSLGEAVDDYYVRADTTAAAAAIVAGAAALLLEAFDRSTPIAIGNALRDTASLLPYDTNDAGAGLLDFQSAVQYLSARQSPVSTHTRTTGIPLLATGVIVADSNGARTSSLLSSYGTMIVAMDQRGGESSVHLLMGMFYLRWNNENPTSLMMFNVKREMHQVYTASGLDGYNRFISILSYDDMYVILLAESYNLTMSSNDPLVGYKITPYILNFGSEPIYNVSLFLSYNLDLFLDGNDDHGKYALGNQELFVYSQSEDYKDFYFGLNASRSLSAFEVGNSSKILDHVTNDNLTGSTTFDGTVGLAMKWDFGVLDPDELANVTIAMGFAENRTLLDASIEKMWELQPSLVMQQQGDLVVVEADLPRIANAGKSYLSTAIVMNVGVETSPIVAAMIIGRTDNNGTKGNLYTSFKSFDEVKPFHAVSITVDWSPEHEGIFSAAWVVAVSVASAISLFSNPASTIATSGASFLDDFLIRDLFVITPITSISVFPKILPSAPFSLNFPGDFGMYSIILTSTVPLGNLTVSKFGNATKWGNVTLTPAESVQGYYNFSLMVFAPLINMDGYHYCDYVLDTEAGWTANVSLQASLKYARSMIFLETAHGSGIGSMLGSGGGTDIDTSGGGGGIGGGIGFPLAEDDSGGLGLPGDLGGSISDIDSLSSISDIIETFRLTTFSGLSNLDAQMADNDIDLVEFPGVALSSEILQLFSGVLIIRPTKEFNSTERSLLYNFTDSGGKLIIMGDYDGRTNLTALNPLLNEYGYFMNGSYDTETTTEIVIGSRLGTGVSSVWLGGGTYILNNQSFGQVMLDGKPVVLLDEESQLALFGSSRIFLNKHLPKCNNSILLDNLMSFMLDNTLICKTRLAENTTRYPVGRSVFLNLEVRDVSGQPVDDLLVVIIFDLPNGSQAYFFAGFVQDGLYTSQFMPSYWKDEGRINGIFFILKTEEYAGTFASISFEFYRPSATNNTPEGTPLFTMPQLAALTFTVVFGSTMIGLVWNRHRRKRRLRVPEIDRTLAEDIDNTFNMLRAAFIQIENLIQQEDVDRIQKVEMIRGMMNVLDKALDEFDKVSGRVGGV